jgi:hypothetical protein
MGENPSEANEATISEPRHLPRPVVKVVPFLITASELRVRKIKRRARSAAIRLVELGLKVKNNRGLSMSIERISDESLERYYESIRRLAEEDRRHKQHFTSSSSVRERADKLRQEMIKRRLQHSPINWPS